MKSKKKKSIAIARPPSDIDKKSIKLLSFKLLREKGLATIKVVL